MWERGTGPCPSLIFLPVLLGSSARHPSIRPSVHPTAFSLSSFCGGREQNLRGLWRDELWIPQAFCGLHTSNGSRLRVREPREALAPPPQASVLCTRSLPSSVGISTVLERIC